MTSKKPKVGGMIQWEITV